uniref:Uncharacterized protein n=1 Tax=Vitis vinifera TaxID=29760 RepID=A5AZ31_VITVI|nr:hypothetical protein VITISV_040843 [Vitis vinifera]
MGSCTFHLSRNSTRLPPHSTRLPPHSTREGIPSGHRHYIRNSATAAITSGCLTSRILLLPPFHLDVLHLEFRSRMGEKAFQLLRIYISGSANNAYPENFAAQFCIMPPCSPILPDICASHIEYKIAEEAMNFMSYMTEASRGWDECPTIPAVREMFVFLNDIMYEELLERRRVCREEFHPAAATFHPGRNSIRPPPLHPEFCYCRHYIRMSHIRNSAASAIPSGCLTSGIQEPDGREGVSTSLDIHIRIADSAYPENFAANFAQWLGVLLKLPDMCDRHL